MNPIIPPPVFSKADFNLGIPTSLGERKNLNSNRLKIDLVSYLARV